MGNKNKMSFENVDWLEIQKKYLDALVSFNSPGAFAHSNPFERFNPLNVGANPSDNSPWVNAMNDWWRSVKPESPNEYQKLFGKVIEQSRNYYFLCEQFSTLVQGMGVNKDADMVGFINTQFKNMESAFLANQSNISWTSLLDNMEHPLELMKMAASSMSHFSNELFNELNPEVKKQRERFLSVPGLGYGRETQDKFQELIRLWVDYQDHYQEYQRVMTGLNQQSLEVMRKKIIAMTRQDEEINSMKQIYDLWVESNENVYSKYVLTDDYSKLNGRLVNSLMAFKKKSQEISEDVLTAMNIPTIGTVNALERRQYDLRKQIKAMQLELKEIKQQIKPEASRPAQKTEKPVQEAEKPVQEVEKPAQKAEKPAQKAEKPARTAEKKVKTVSKASAAETSAKAVESKRVKKKVQKTTSRPDRKKTKQKAKKSAADNKDIIKLKF